MEKRKLNKKNTLFESLEELVETLREKCPWDKKQKIDNVKVYLIEEMYELLDAIDSGKPEAALEELGDVLFQLFFMSQLYREKGHFGIKDAVKFNLEKMIRRHPHVFGEAEAKSAEDVRKKWQAIKMAEKAGSKNEGLLDSVPKNLPAMMRAYRITQRAGSIGFDWTDISGVIEKADEEWQEFKAALKSGDTAGTQSELGDLLFTIVNISRILRIHPENALSGTVNKFITRFQYIEKKLAEQKISLESAGLEKMDALWDEAKNLERA